MERMTNDTQSTQNERVNSNNPLDCISRQAAIEKFEPWLKVDGYSEGELNMLKAVLYELRFLPSAQSEITLESAIDYLHSIGWMQEHDRTLTESVQPEIIHCESCKHWKNEHICESLSRYGTFETPKNFYCGYGKEK